MPNQCLLFLKCLFLQISFLFVVYLRSGEEEEEIIHMGNAIMSFYSALIDLLGRCAPEMHVRHFTVD